MVQITVKVLLSDNGRYIILDIKVQDTHMLLVNVYAPCGKSSEQVPFYEKLYNILKDLYVNDKFMIMGGDFNIIMNYSLDRAGGNVHQKAKAVDTVVKLMSHFDLSDIWRIRNPRLRKYTWRQRNPLIQSRLDYWLISDGLQDFIRVCDIQPAFHTDHSSIVLKIESKSSDKHGPSYWKFNDSLCEDSVYVNGLREKNLEWCLKYNDITDKRLFWELIKFEIRSYTQIFSKKVVKDRNTRLHELEKKFKEAEDSLNSNPCDETQTTWENLKAEISKHYDHVTQGVFVRSRADWMEKGEKNNKYFLNLEKSHKGKSSIRCILNDNGTECCDEKDILNEIKRFYASLYSSKHVDLNSPQSHMFLNGDHIPKLDDDDRDSCEGELTNNECYKVLCKMSNGKAPGNDGLTVQFYKTFWNIVGHHVVNSLNDAYKKGELSNSQKQGVITLILKKSKDKRKVENYRPITLLNVDLKLGSKIIADRIARVMPSLISCNQSAFVSGRYIGDAVRTVADILYFVKDKNDPGILMCIDFEKAYDSIDHGFLYRVLEVFNFGVSVRKWIQTFYTDVCSCVMNNGTSTGYFTIQRGLRQGDPLSCQLFNLVIETLCIQLINNKEIVGIQVNPNIQVKLSCYADDMCLFLQDINSAKIVMNIFRDFEDCSCLKVNYNKTEAMWIGSARNNTSKPLDVKWTNQVKVLGIYFTYDEKVFYSLNYDDKFKSLECLLNMWRQRDLTAIGKITIIKTFGLSKFLYTSTMIGMPVSIQKRVNNIMFKFIWNGPDKIKRSVLCADLNRGGLKMFDLKSKVKTQAIMWLKRFLMPNEAGWKDILANYLNKYGGKNMLNNNFDVNKLLAYDIIPPFYINALKLWSEINSFEPTNAEEVCRQGIWNNKFILIGNKSVYYSKFDEAGFHTIYDFFEDKNTIKDIRSDDRFNTIDVLKWYGLIHALPKHWRDIICKKGLCWTGQIEYGLRMPNGFIPMDKVKSNSIYVWFRDKEKVESISQHYFKRVYELSDDECYDLFVMPFKVTLDTKLRWFQYRVMHNIVPTNVWLQKVGLTNSDLCSFCKKEKETITHMFVECEKVVDFWQQVQTRYNIMDGLDIFSKVYGMLDCKNANYALINHILIIVKKYIYKCRADQINFSLTALKNMIHSTIKLEYYCAHRKSTLEFHF
jgi:hypothetical protein